MTPLTLMCFSIGPSHVTENVCRGTPYGAGASVGVSGYISCRGGVTYQYRQLPRGRLAVVYFMKSETDT